MANTFPFGGETQTIPAVGDTGYGPELIQFWNAIGQFAFQNPADFSNSTLTLRQVIQTIIGNSPTYLTIAPEGSSTACAVQLYSDSALTNGNTLFVGTDGTTQSYITSGKLGTGVALKLNIGVGTNTNITLNTDGSVTIPGAITISGLINGQTISSSANFTGTLAVAGSVTGGTYNGQTISSAANLTGTLAVASDTTVGGTLGVTGNVTGGTYNGQTISSSAAFSGSLAVAGATNMSGTMTFDGTHTITSLPTPVNASDVATKSYVDSKGVGLSWKSAVQAATPGTNLNATFANHGGVGDTLTNAGTQAAFALDGYSASLNDRILVKNQTTAYQNGIYTVTTLGSTSTNWVLTRATDYNTAALVDSAANLVLNGTVNEFTDWVQTYNVQTFNSDPLVYAQTSGNGAGVNAVYGTTNQIAVTSNTGEITFSLAPNVVIPTPGSGTALVVNGSSSLSTAGSASIGTTLGVTGATTLSSNVTINAPASGNALTATGVAGQSTVQVNVANSALSGTSGVTVTDGYSGAGVTSQLAISATGNTSGAAILLSGNGASSPNKYIRVQGGSLKVNNSGNTATILSLDDSGNLSTPGNMSATGTLTVSGSSSLAGVTASGTLTGAGVYSSSGNYYSSNSSNKLMFTDSNDGYLRINNGGAFSNGVYTPNNLRVDGSLYVGSTTYVSSSVTSYGSLSINGSGGGYTGVQLNDGGRRPTFMSNNSTAGVYTTGGGYWLWDDDGTNFNVQHTIITQGNIEAYSDESLKTGVLTIPNALDKVNALRGVYYTVKKDLKQSLGVIAQEVEKVIPEVVGQGKDGLKTVAYGNLVGVLIEAIKELSQKFDNLEAKLGI